MNEIKNHLNAEISHNLALIHDRIREAAIRAGRDQDEIDLIAVTKKKNALVIKTLIENGVSKIGESYLQEAIFKIDLLGDMPAEWHMIGPVQKGKDKQVARYFSTVHSIDSVALAGQLSKAADKLGKEMSGFLEMNVSGESTKHGWQAWDRSRWEELLPDVEEILSLRSLKILGLMTMAPYNKDPEASRVYFKKLHDLREYLTIRNAKANLACLSMGMSGDFEVAIEEGATMLRIGSALVGPRN